MNDGYPGVLSHRFVVVAVVTYIYAVATYGLFLGGGLGWIPAIVFRLVAAYLWPLLSAPFSGR